MENIMRALNGSKIKQSQYATVIVSEINGKSYEVSVFDILWLDYDFNSKFNLLFPVLTNKSDWGMDNSNLTNVFNALSKASSPYNLNTPKFT